MLIKKGPRIPSSEITDEAHYLRRRDFIRLAGGAALGIAAGGAVSVSGSNGLNAPKTAEPANPTPATPIPNIVRRMVTTNDPPNTFEQIIGYNNFYEFGTNKSDPKQYAGRLTTSPWTVKIDGL